MKIEILFPAFANLYGEIVAIQYLSQCLPDAQFINTELTDIPAFATEDVDMIFMGSMTENQQELVIEKLLPYKDRINDLISSGKVFLIVGNAVEIFCKYIETESGKIPALGIFEEYAVRNMNSRYNSLIMGKMENFKIIGFKSQFSHIYGDNSSEYLYEVIRGDGINPGSKFEGLRRNNFLATYTLGPLLLLNPDLLKYIFTLLNIPDQELKYNDCIRRAYEVRLKEFENPKTIY